ncbi:hypothetical protein C5167_000678 [Papaver somniferum]|uniref:Uncharacterized protein n=1 Tax=Papaver somniferum TaxID=3469 RepID=A0A4Y7KWM9_PAPSO|nr:hypothetical protein C5167_000678 [Papaver somniferum]
MLSTSIELHPGIFPTPRDFIKFRTLVQWAFDLRVLGLHPEVVLVPVHRPCTRTILPSSISVNSSIASLPHPWIANADIIVFQDTKLNSLIPLKTSNALSIEPHFAYISIMALQTDML